jgi:haloalkane dehalogenase
MNRRSFLARIGGTVSAGSLVRGSVALRFGWARGKTETTAAQWHAARRFVETRFGRIAYVERGRGSVALFLHGFPLNGFQWRGAFDRLAADRRCVAPDFLALGYTKVARGQGVGPNDQVAAIVGMLDALTIEHVDLIGSDSGGAVAQLLVARHPERVRSLLLTNCDTEPDSPPPALRPVIDMAHAGTYPDQWLAPWLADKALARSVSGLGGLTYTYPESLADETIECYLAPLVASPARKALVNAYAIALERNPLAGIAPALARCKVPARIVWGTGDDIFSHDSPDYLARTFGNSRGVRRVPRAKLFFPEEFPDLIADEARRLWA